MIGGKWWSFQLQHICVQCSNRVMQAAKRLLKLSPQTLERHSVNAKYCYYIWKCPLIWSLVQKDHFNSVVTNSNPCERKHFHTLRYSSVKSARTVRSQCLMEETTICINGELFMLTKRGFIEIKHYTPLRWNYLCLETPHPACPLLNSFKELIVSAVQMWPNELRYVNLHNYPASLSG